MTSARGLLATVCLAWIAVAVPEVARAGCGDHARSPASSFEFDLESILTPPDRPTVPDAPARPCAGASCSRRPEPPATAPTVARIVTDRALLADRVDPPEMADGRAPIVRDRPSHDPPALDRPDRPPRD